EQEHADHREEPRQREPRAGALHVVEHDDPQSVDAVEQRERQQQPVPRAPERALPAELDELEVDPLHPAAEHVHDEHVPDGEEQQDDPADPHEQPRPELVAARWPLAAGDGALHGAALEAGALARLGLDHHHRSPRMAFPMTYVTGTMAPITITRVAYHSRAWYSDAFGQKSRSMIRTPLTAW